MESPDSSPPEKGNTRRTIKRVLLGLLVAGIGYVMWENRGPVSLVFVKWRGSLPVYALVWACLLVGFGAGWLVARRPWKKEAKAGAATESRPVAAPVKPGHPPRERGRRGTTTAPMAASLPATEPDSSPGAPTDEARAVVNVEEDPLVWNPGVLPDDVKGKVATTPPADAADPATDSPVEPPEPADTPKAEAPAPPPNDSEPSGNTAPASSGPDETPSPAAPAKPAFAKPFAKPTPTRPEAPDTDEGDDASSEEK